MSKEKEDKIVSLTGSLEDWNKDMTPWSAPALSKKSASFGGEGEKYLK